MGRTRHEKTDSLDGRNGLHWPRSRRGSAGAGRRGGRRVAAWPGDLGRRRARGRAGRRRGAPGRRAHRRRALDSGALRPHPVEPRRHDRQSGPRHRVGPPQACLRQRLGRGPLRDASRRRRLRRGHPRGQRRAREGLRRVGGRGGTGSSGGRARRSPARGHRAGQAGRRAGEDVRRVPLVRRGPRGQRHAVGELDPPARRGAGAPLARRSRRSRRAPSTSRRPRPSP